MNKKRLGSLEARWYWWVLLCCKDAGDGVSHPDTQVCPELTEDWQVTLVTEVRAAALQSHQRQHLITTFQFTFPCFCLPTSQEKLRSISPEVPALPQMWWTMTCLYEGSWRGTPPGLSGSLMPQQTDAERWPASDVRQEAISWSLHMAVPPLSNHRPQRKHWKWMVL